MRYASTLNLFVFKSIFRLRAELLTFLAVFGLLMLSQKAFADDADVLPQGRFRLRLATAYSQAGNQFNSSGEAESFGSKFTRPLDVKLLSALTPDSKIKQLVQALGLPATIASLKTDVNMSILTNVIALEYGVTERLSVGLILPIIHSEIEVNATSNPDPKFSVEANKKLPATVKSQIAGSTSIDGINSLLATRFKYSHGLTSWSETGLGDLELGGKYNYLRAHPFLATLKAGVRVPTGKQKDQDNLVDVSFGDGQFDVGIYNYVDYHALSNLWFTLETGYTAQLPNTDSYRVPISTDLPIGAGTLSLDRKLGDYYELGLEANYSFFKSLILSGKYRFLQKFSDSYSGPSGLDTALLEANTDQYFHEFQLTAEYTNVAAVRAGRSHFPYALAVIYKQPFAGENTPDIRTLAVQGKVYF